MPIYSVLAHEDDVSTSPPPTGGRRSRHTAHGGAGGGAWSPDAGRGAGSKKAASRCGALVHVPLLAGGIPDLRLDALAVEREGARLELHPDGGLGVERELVAREPRQQLRLPHRRVADHHDLEHVVLLHC